MTEHYENGSASEREPIIVSPTEQEETRARLMPDAPEKKAEPLALYRPFPHWELPAPMADYVGAAADALGSDAAYVALPLLSAAAGVIGNARRIRLKRGWTEPSIIWALPVGESGSGKSPALDAALRPVRRMQNERFAAFESQKSEHALKLARYEDAKKLWHAQKPPKPGEHDRRGLVPLEPPEPHPERIVVGDATIEALAVLLQQNPRGLLLSRDELSAWLGSFERYSKGLADVGFWLEMFGGRPLTIDRKTGQPAVIHVPMAAVSIAGSIQPSVLQRALGREHIEDGLAARFLFAMPPTSAKSWTEAEIDEGTEDRLREMFQQLRALEVFSDEIGNPAPLVLSMTPDARQLWLEFYAEHAAVQASSHGDMSAALSKLEGYCARIALVLHLVTDATDGGRTPVSAESVGAAVELVRWFRYEHGRIYQRLRQTEAQSQNHALAEKILEALRDSESGLTRWEISNVLGRNRGRDEIQAALGILTASGQASCDKSKGGKGRPTERWSFQTPTKKRSNEERGVEE